MQRLEQEAVLATLQESFRDVASKTGMKPRDVCHYLLSHHVKLLGEKFAFDQFNAEEFSEVGLFPSGPVEADGATHYYNVSAEIAACIVEQRPGHFVQVTFGSPIPNAAMLRTYKYRNPSNVAIVDAQGNWTGVVAYFREWQGFIEMAVRHINASRVHEANL